ncbi:MAG TPA: hypothetical protein VL494_13395 [Steroidobacteraceae bacterium]|jgi:hypothetical protein|nr:hypothetical protein [Steroidobacteraceae bacterium]
MLTQEQILETVRSGRKSETIDGRDYGRLVDFFPVENYEDFGFKLRDGAEPTAPKPWTREAVLEQLREDVAFGFEKALNKRGISAGCMAEVIRMWMWVLEEPDPEETEGYAQYGLPMFKAVALKFGFANPIGDDTGREFKYSMEAD